jgi:Zn-dependent peptidase ImmA (M78 family)
VIGPVSLVFLHELGHALLDVLQIPILGREEDASDQLATYMLL